MEINILSEEIKSEIKRVEKLIQANKQQAIKTENQTAMLLAVQKNLSSLELEVERNTIYLQAVSDQLTSKTVEAGASMMNENLVFSKAIPPLNPTRPNKRLVVVFLGFYLQP